MEGPAGIRAAPDPAAPTVLDRSRRWENLGGLRERLHPRSAAPQERGASRAGLGAGSAAWPCPHGPCVPFPCSHCAVCPSPARTVPSPALTVPSPAQHTHPAQDEPLAPS